MDPITHGLLGGVASQAFFNRSLGRMAGLIGVLAAWLPDLDVFIINSSDPVSGYILHRGFTHSLLFIPLGALLVALPFWFSRWGSDKKLAIWGAAAVGIATHGICDAVTSYGTLLLWPFSNMRIAWDVMPIVDLFVWSVLVIGFALAMILRNRSVAIATLVILLGYTGIGVVNNARARVAIHALAEARGHSPERVRAMPSPGTMVLWRGIYEYRGAIHVDGVRTPYFGSTLASPGESIALASVDDVLHTSADRDEIERVFGVFAWFSDGYVAVVREDPTVIVSDIRYGGAVDSIAPMWGIEFAPDGPDNWRGMRSSGSDGEDEGRAGFARELWTLLREGDDRFVRVPDAVDYVVAKRSDSPSADEAADDEPQPADFDEPLPAGG